MDFKSNRVTRFDESAISSSECTLRYLGRRIDYLPTAKNFILEDLRFQPLQMLQFRICCPQVETLYGPLLTRLPDG